MTKLILINSVTMNIEIIYIFIDHYNTIQTDTQSYQGRPERDGNI